jgi:opacity protein-like surface antigen
MKRILAVFIVSIMLAVMAPVMVQAQCGNIRHRHGNAVHTHKSCVGDGHKHGRSFWQKHRDKVTLIGGALGGAAIGGLAGGKKGAAIGAIVGGGGAAVYTYGIRKRRKPAR